MTKADRNRILKDANGQISDHLRNHIHLTNCIHLKNHMHKQSPILTDKSLMRDLMVLQRSRSLRDPSASPPSWHSPSVADLLPKKGDKDVVEGRRSIGSERRRESRRLSGSSPPFSNLAPSKVVPGELSRGNDRVPVISDRSSKSGVRDGRRIKREESSRKSTRVDFLSEDEDPLQDQDVNVLANDTVSRNSESKSRKSKQKGKHSQDFGVRILSEQLNEVAMDSDVASSDVHLHGRRSQLEKTGEAIEASIRGCSGLNRGKRRKFRSARRTKATQSRDIRGQNENLSVASNSFNQGSARPRYRMEEEEEEYGGHSVMRDPRNGCGIPWNWSRIHHRGKTFLDMAGRSLSCGLSESRLRKGGMASHERNVDNMPVESDYSSSSKQSDAEALPLLVDVSGSQESTDNAGWVHDYSGELGLYADNLLKNNVDSDLASEARSGGQQKLRNCNSRHQNLTQKYMPKTFRDLVGQNLVAQALSNAVVRRKVGLLYVFYGPHGTGKTSCARIFAKALNCQSLEHPKPCGYCNFCNAHDMGKSRNIKEVGPVNNFDFESIMDLLDNMIISHLPSQYRVFIFDDCDTLSPDSWSAISKVIDRTPRRVVFILVSSSLDVLPHIIISRCQKFYFPKLKDADIIYTLQWIASKEDIDIDKDALKLIASRSDGSLRDAEMTLEQLSLLGLKISVPLVQELVGLISDEKLVDLLDIALSADTVNTVKNLRVIMETGVEPLALMSQLATVITDILAGSYDFTKERHRRKFFRRQPLSKDDMEKLRQALKTLSEAEKQLRMSNDKLTWLTAALLQLAPDQQYMLRGSSTETSFNHSPLTLHNTNGRETVRRGGEHAEIPNHDRGLLTQHRSENYPVGTSGASAGISVDRKRSAGTAVAPQKTSAVSSDTIRGNNRLISGKSCNRYEEIWLGMIGKIQFNSIREFLYQEGKLISVSFGAAPTVQLMFSSHLTKLKAEKFRAHILQAFESFLGSQVTLEIRCESDKVTSEGFHAPLVLPASINALSQCQTAVEPESGAGRSEIVELPASPREINGIGHFDNNAESSKRALQRARVGETVSTGSMSERRKLGEPSQSMSLVRGKVSLAHVIQQAEGCKQNGWSKRKAVSIAEKLEQENLRLEPRSRSLLCWKASRVTRRKLSRLKIRTRRPHALLKLVSCGKCFSSKSPR
ncbi:protein STICHEL-like 3 [Mercurialis annua]|uniref:protein STICHEL-like 3 n=1 Tax=Mercurialis annua TaxID=3986 RepID=UPI00215E1AEB|nr:protein STICHEL-like 3 [Mercurialis annua]